MRKEVEKIGRDWVQVKDMEFMEEDDSELSEWEAELNKEISEEEYERAVRRVKTKSALGLDGIDYKMIKDLPLRYRNV